MDYVVSANAVQYIDDAGRVLGEVTFPSAGDGIVDINHTFVDDSLRGQGIAGKLLEQAVQTIDAGGQKARPTCSYAVRWFEKHPEWARLVAE